MRKPLAEKEPLNNGLPGSAAGGVDRERERKREKSVLSIPGSQDSMEISFHVGGREGQIKRERDINGHLETRGGIDEIRKIFYPLNFRFVHANENIIRRIIVVLFLFFFFSLLSKSDA